MWANAQREGRPACTKMQRAHLHVYLFIRVFRSRQLSNWSFWYHQEMNRSLRVDVVKSYRLIKHQSNRLTKHTTYAAVE